MSESAEDKNKQPVNDESVNIEELAVSVTRKIHINITTIAGVLLFVIGTTWTVAHILLINPKVEQLKDKEQTINDITVSYKDLEQKHNKLGQDYVTIKKTNMVPTLLNPVSGRHISGRFIDFRWDYDINPGFKDFVLELKRINKKGEVLKRRYQIPDANRKSMDFEVPQGTSGEFFWRIGTGELLAVEDYKKEEESSPVEEFVEMSLDKDKQISFPSDTHLWSRYGNFHLYDSVYEKIRSTGEITVGMTATFLSYDHTIDCQGRPNTFDMIFIEWISKKLEENENIGRPIKIVLRTYKWKDLFKAVSTGDVDVALANITISSKREKKYENLVFTNGYRENKQRIIFSKNHNPELLKIRLTKSKLGAVLSGATLATQQATINKASAEHLNGVFKFKHEYTYSSYVDVIDAVRRGKADFGMIDSVRIETVGYPEIGVINFNLDPYLNDLYKEMSGGNVEKYGIAVHSKSGKSKLVKILNSIIDSDEWKKKYDVILEKNKAGNLITGFQC